MANSNGVKTDSSEKQGLQEVILEETPATTEENEWQIKYEETEAKYRRALADYQNLEKRVQQDKSEWLKLANRDVILHFLSVLDTLILASNHTSDQGLMVSVNQFRDVLKSEGVVKIETAGKDFDPHLMEAVSQTQGKEGKVIEEVREGYILHDKLLRPSQVIVGNGE